VASTAQIEAASKGKPMTAIAGFNCIDGIVIAADTEETYGDDKVYAHKLFPAERPTSRVCVAGAGPAYLIDYANEQIIAAVDAGISNSMTFKSSLIDLLDNLYRDKFKRYPVDSQLELRIQLLVAAQFTKEDDPSVWMSPAMFECQSNLVTAVGRMKQSCILGAGELLKEMALQLSGWGLDTGTAEWA
jgi:hypothetical protein